MTNLRLLCILIVLAAVCCQVVHPEEIIKVNNGGHKGKWARTFSMCPKGSYAWAYQTKVESPTWGDDTAMNGISLGCTPTGPNKKYTWVYSNYGPWGGWSRYAKCVHGIRGFRLQVKHGGDDMAATNIMFLCSDWVVASAIVHGGKWGPASVCSGGKVICGMKTRVQSKKWFGDDTALNDVQFVCCPR